ncbi:MAG: NEL-type E3 ubiquitin ligase domain-containing protein [Rhabdochlamydiaceae bacterium]
MSVSSSNLNTVSLAHNSNILLQENIYTPESFLKILENQGHFPAHFTVKGNLILSNRTDLSALPEGLHVEGALDLSFADGITLPEGLYVKGDLILNGFYKLKALPERLHVGGGLYLYNCDALIALPKEFYVGGNLDFGNCCNLMALPEGLHVKGHLSLYRCIRLTALPKKLQVEGNLNIFDCFCLNFLHEGLCVGGNLHCGGYCGNSVGLISLPENLQVKGDLLLQDCISVPSLPESLQLKGHLCIENCINLTSLPSWITTLGALPNGQIRQVELTRTGLSQAIIERLRQTPAPGMQFYFSQERSAPVRVFTTLNEAFEFWKKETKCSDLSVPSIEILDAHLPSVLTFLSQLAVTAEYKNINARAMLAQRIFQAFNWMATKDTTIKNRAFYIIYQGTTSCDDRIISALDELELMINIHELENAEYPEDKLHQIGKSYLLLGMVNGKAKEHIQTLTWVDEVEVYLAFRINLRDRFNLPLLTRNMIFTRSAQVTEEQLKKAGNAIEQACTEEKLDQFLEEWSPWVRHKRRMSVPAYEKLPPVSVEESELVCCLTEEVTTQPVWYDGHIYDYKSFVKTYAQSGQNPFNRKLINLSELNRIINP